MLSHAGPTNAATRMNGASIELRNYFGDVIKNYTISTANSPSAMTYDVVLSYPSPSNSASPSMSPSTRCVTAGWKVCDWLSCR